MQNPKMERITKQERTKYRILIEGMLNAYRATPHPSTGRSPYELMFGWKMRLGTLPEILKIRKRGNDAEVRRNDTIYKFKSKRNHDKHRNVRNSTIAVGDRILMKGRRTDQLSPLSGRVIKVSGHAVTARFDNGKMFIRDKSHFKIIREEMNFERQETEERSMTQNVRNERRNNQKTRYALWDETDYDEAEKGSMDSYSVNISVQNPETFNLHSVGRP